MCLLHEREESTQDNQAVCVCGQQQQQAHGEGSGSNWHRLLATWKEENEENDGKADATVLSDEISSNDFKHKCYISQQV